MTTFTRRATIATLQNAVAANGNGAQLLVFEGPAGAYVSGCIQVAGTFTATISFQATVDGVNWFPLETSSLGVSATVGSSATAPGIWRFNCAGLFAIRAPVAWTSGTSVTVTGSLVA